MKFKIGDKVIYAKKDPRSFREDKLEIGSIFTVARSSHAEETLGGKYDLYHCKIDGVFIAFFEHQLLPLNDLTKLLYPEAKEIE